MGKKRLRHVIMFFWMYFKGYVFFGSPTSLDSTVPGTPLGGIAPGDRQVSFGGPINQEDLRWGDILMGLAGWNVIHTIDMHTYIYIQPIGQNMRLCGVWSWELPHDEMHDQENCHSFTFLRSGRCVLWIKVTQGTIISIQFVIWFHEPWSNHWAINSSFVKPGVALHSLCNLQNASGWNGPIAS